MNELQVFKHNT